MNKVIIMKKKVYIGVISNENLKESFEKWWVTDFSKIPKLTLFHKLSVWSVLGSKIEIHQVLNFSLDAGFGIFMRF